MTSPKQAKWLDGRTCPDCENADHKTVELQMVKIEVDDTDIQWEKWECPACLYFEWEEIDSSTAT